MEKRPKNSAIKPLPGGKEGSTQSWRYKTPLPKRTLEWMLKVISYKAP